MELDKMIEDVKTIIFNRGDLMNVHQDLDIEDVEFEHFKSSEPFNIERSAHRLIALNHIVIFIDAYGDGRIPTKLLKNRWGDKGIITPKNK